MNLNTLYAITFNKNGYDPVIDYIKGLCILFVIWTHCISRGDLGHILFPFWGDTAVPIFLIIQVFHYYKKGISVRMPSTSKLYKRILQPFIIMIVLMFLTQFFIYYNVTKGSFTPSLYWNKRGPGSYYIFIYLELAIVIPLFAPLFKRLSNKWLCFLFMVLSQLIEFVTCITHCPDSIYRILFFRYIFLIYIGYLMTANELKLNKLTLFGCLVSIFFLYLFAYTETDMEPLFCTHLRLWPLCHWVCYIYIAYFFLAFLKYTYTKLFYYSTISNYIEKIGKYSYEIFLFQIFYYSTFSIYVGKALTYINYFPAQKILYVLFSTAICVIPVVYLKNKRTNNTTNLAI